MTLSAWRERREGPVRVGQGCRTTGALPCARVHTCTNTPGDRGAAVVGSQLPREGGREGGSS